MNERELFIQNYIKYVNNQADFTILNETENTFYDDAVDDAWVMWQLSASRQGYKLVPLEPTEKMIDAMEQFMDYEHADMESAYKAMIGVIDE